MMHYNPRIYLASSYARRQEMQQRAEELKRAHCKIVSTWIDGHHETRPDIDLNPTDGERRMWAHEDLGDIMKCNTMIVFTNEGLSRGGYRVEMGILIGWNLAYGTHFPTSSKKIKRLIIIGPTTCVFDLILYPWITVYPTWEDFAVKEL